MATFDRARTQSLRQSTNPPAPARQSAPLSPVQALGNQLMQAMQPKLEVNAPNDSYEQEADRFAGQVTNAAPAQRAAQEPEKKKDDKAAQKKPLAAQATPLIQRAGNMPDDKKKEDKTAQKTGNVGDDKKKDNKATQKMPIQRANQAPDDKKKDDKKKDDKKKGNKTAQKAGNAPEKKKADKAAQKMALQRATTAPMAEDEEKAQTKRANPAQLDDKKEKKDDDKSAQKLPVQRAAAAPTSAPTSIEQDVERQKQGGRPLSTAERHYFEPRFGADFSQVRIHDDAAAARAASDLNAKAFTQGSHIFFGSGYHQPNDTPGRQLMAHELTHTLQQGGAQPAAPQAKAITPRSPTVVQRADDAPPADNTPASNQYFILPERRGSTYRINVPSLTVPHVKYAAAQAERSRLFRQAGYRRGGETDQVRLWTTGLGPSVVTKLRDAGLPTEGGPYLIRRRTGNPEAFQALGPTSVIAERLTIPFWNSNGQFKVFDIDHMVDLQISGWPSQSWAHNIFNFQLLDSDNNRGDRRGTAARVLWDSIDTVADEVRTQIPASDWPNGQAPRSRADVLANYDLVFQSVTSQTIANADVWDREAISRGDQLQNLKSQGPIAGIYDLNERMPRTELRQPTGVLSPHPSSLQVSALLGNQNERLIYRRGGGAPARFRWAGASERPRGNPQLQAWTRGFGFNRINLDWEPQNEVLGTVDGMIYQNNRISSSVFSQPITNLEIRSIGTAVRSSGMPSGNAPNFERWAGLIYDAVVQGRLQGMTFGFTGASPLTVVSTGFTDTGLVTRARLDLTIPLLTGNSVDVVFDGDEIRAEKIFSTDQIQAPRPFHINNASLGLSIGTQTGLQAVGRAEFAIDRVGQGSIEARAGTSTGSPTGPGFALAGTFNFDSQLFEPSNLALRYENNQFSGEGHIGIPSGKLRGIRSAQIDMSYAAGVFTANGTVQPAIPGVQQGTLNVVYSEQEGLVIAGALQLAENPAIRSGSIDARVERSPDGNYKVRAAGRAQPKIPGLNSELNVTYDDGAFDMEVTAAFGRGMLQGQLRAAATNRAVNPETGQPGGEPTERITVYGGGSVTVQFAPWLQGTAGIKLLPNGEIEISGSIGLPNTVNLFDARRFDRNIFRVSIDIPIVGVSVAGQRIGIFATIGGGLDLRAGIGPGELRDLNLGVTYNPSHEDQTHITGHGEFVIPADAGLRLSIHGGVGVGIPIVSAEAGIEMSGELGLQGEARAAVDVDWTPQRGIVLDAEGSIFVEPRLKLDVSAYVAVTADLLLTTIDIYSNRWRLAGTEIGSNLRFGLTFPIHYEQGRPFNLSTDDVQFVIPEIDPESILSSVFSD